MAKFDYEYIGYDYRIFYLSTFEINTMPDLIKGIAAT